MSEPENFPVGHTFTDSSGQERVTTPFGFNAYVTLDGATAAALALGANGSTWFTWRLDDGSYDHTAVPDPRGPGHPGELVAAFTVSGYGKRKRAVPVAPEENR
jgi:hypothetical protein